MAKSNQQQQQIQVNAADEMSLGRYSNLMMVAHSPDEFMLDWLLNTPNGTHLVSRIIVAPGHVKRIIEALTINLRQYEEKFGEIKVIDQDDQKFH
ncbi:MAG: DUF3467 domain-containing protein [Deltaproteobacteria bacterium]|nr:DUF3467 domain-containing protein [Deltaproteobacteria bacterium]